MGFKIRTRKEVNPTKCALLTIESLTGQNMNGNSVNPVPMTSNTFIQIDNSETPRYRGSKGGQSIKSTDQRSDYV